MSIDALFSLTQEQRRVHQIAAIEPDGWVIYERGDYRWLGARDDTIQAVMRIASPADPVLPNQIAMLLALLINTSPRRALNLGFGTGAFERFFHDRLPALEMVSVESAPGVVAIAREYFCIAHDWPVQIQTAEDYLAQSRLDFDLMLCDIFAGEHHAACLSDAAFYSAAAQRLAEQGVLSLNLYPQSEAELVTILLALRQSFSWTMLVKIPGHGNIVVLACTQPLPSDAELVQRAGSLTETLKLDFGDMLSHVERLPLPAR